MKFVKKLEYIMRTDTIYFCSRECMQNKMAQVNRNAYVKIKHTYLYDLYGMPFYMVYTEMKDSPYHWPIFMLPIMKPILNKTNTPIYYTMTSING